VLQTLFTHILVRKEGRVGVFTNKYLASYGAGLDIATFYDLVFRIEYALNQDLEDSFFLNLKAAF
jgi:hypothetical protein